MWDMSLKHVGEEGRTMIGNICSDALESILSVKDKIVDER
jgi:hypothetical protein